MFHRNLPSCLRRTPDHIKKGTIPILLEPNIRGSSGAPLDGAITIALEVPADDRERLPITKLTSEQAGVAAAHLNSLRNRPDLQGYIQLLVSPDVERDAGLHLGGEVWSRGRDLIVAWQVGHGVKTTFFRCGGLRDAG